MSDLKPSITIDLRPVPVFNAKFSPDGHYVAAWGLETATICDVVDAEKLFDLTHEDDIWYLEFVLGGSRIITCDRKRNLKVWDSEGQNIFTQRLASSTAIATGANGTRYAIKPGFSRPAEIWNIGTRGCVVAPQSSEGALSLALDASGSRLAYLCSDTIHVFDVDEERELCCVPSDAALDLRFSQDGLSLAAWGNWDGRRENLNGFILDVNSGGRVVLKQLVDQLIFGPDSNSIAVAYNESVTPAILSLSAPVCLKGHTAAIKGITFNPQGTILATASDDRSARLWHTTFGEQIALLPHHGHVYSVSFNHAGNRLVTTEAGTILIWNFPALTRGGLVENGLRIE